MTSKQPSSSARSAPKGRPTPPRNQRASGRQFFTPTIQWLLVVLLAVIVFGAIFYFGRDVESNLNGSGISPSTASASTDSSPLR